MLIDISKPEPELDSDGTQTFTFTLSLLVMRSFSRSLRSGKPIVEPEVDLSAFLERQRISELGPSSALLGQEDADDGDVDHTLSHISSRVSSLPVSKKGKVEQIEWNQQLEEMSREKASAEAARSMHDFYLLGCSLWS
jgi:hypothetical protein